MHKSGGGYCSHLDPSSSLRTNLQNSSMHKLGGYCSYLDPSSSSYSECLDISISLSASFTSSRSTTSARRSRAWREEQEKIKSVDKTDKREEGREEQKRRRREGGGGESYIGLIHTTNYCKPSNFHLQHRQFSINNKEGFSLVPRPCPAFRHLQYRKAAWAWERG